MDYIKGQYADIEVYRNYNSDRMGFHTDRIESVESCSEDEEDYNSSVCANSSVIFADMYEPENKILVLKIK